ncbi:chromosome partition protein MukB [Xanthomonas hyacinthi]|uniref:Chromosome partition protein MukB n=1 Tax=Xanthomonas hyacinthi TaxID=56455 RepID=A0A2S7EUC7_9XANT|nr:chromosome partition protein MukB [Xanthomonas hyacinthi]KLD78159.1 cell division protein [Xanthomonas hyacinthi DSM 19077]PPU96746.1 chromosome partition protein MukB [Xanthomonas hyacinthi]QGY76308.1 chromosome partition protein MukB [Xanthomonas hyacinthi]
MSRTLAEALVLVNWKGVFYERYLLDRHVTALEGSNGAGKTTVMIAAYVALLPDMSRLRFTNLGETGATGGDKGIWGRLGDPGRPSYAVIDFVLAGAQRLVAGVHLERKGEPSVEPISFIVWNLDPAVRLQDLLLVAQGGVESVPELQELRDNAARLGGRLQSFPSAREYFAALFDQGVMPLRLGTDEERNKFNEMLRTSMTGGISRVLTSELRSFLLREQSGLADTLQRMRTNLDACRRTRVEVQESRRLEQEIGSVFEAGQAMFAAAFLATRERADELARRMVEAQSARDHAFQAQEAAREVLGEILAELNALDTRKGELDRVLESARIWCAKMKDALAALSTLQQCVTRLAETESEAQEAGRLQSEAETLRTRNREELKRAREDYMRAAKGLADLQQGIEELHRRAAAYRQATRRLRQAEANVQAAPLLPAQFADHLASARDTLERIDRERREARTRLSDALEHRARHEQLLAALRRLVGRDVEVIAAHDVATEALNHHRQLSVLAEQLPGIERELAEAQQLQVRQARVRAQASEVGVVLNQAPATQVVDALLIGTEAERSAHEQAQRTANHEVAELRRRREDLQKQLRHLLAREPQWCTLAQCAIRLSEHLGTRVKDRNSLDAARPLLSEQHAETGRAEQQARQAQERLIQEARELLAAGGPFSPALLQLKDRLGAELLAGSYEEVAIEEAAVLEARLGALAQALVVDDPTVATRIAIDRPEELTDVLLVSRDADLYRLAEASGSTMAGEGDLVVQEGIALRVSRIPAKPRLGRRAREKRAADLQAQAEERTLELNAARNVRRTLERLLADGDALLAGLEVWLAGDPADAIIEAQQAIALTDEQIEQQRETADRHAAEAQALQPRIGRLRSLLGEAMLLDPPDHAERVQTLSERASQAGEARNWIAANQERALRVERGLGDLRQLPLSDMDMEDLKRHTDALEKQRQQLDAGVEALEYLCDNAEALAWEEAPRRLEDSQELVPALQAQLSEAETLQQDIENKVAQAEAQYDRAHTRFLAIQSQYANAKHGHESAAEYFNALGIPAPTEEALSSAIAEVERLEQELHTHWARRDELLTAKGNQEHGLQSAQQDLQLADDKLAAERREAEPARKRWDDLLGWAMRDGLVGELLTKTPEGFADIRGHINFVQEAKIRRVVLLERLGSARGGETLLAELQLLRDTSDAAFADAILELWLAVRDWLRRRLPAQVAEVDDPREALVRLRDQLSDLEERLTRQESDLRGTSEDVARGIDVQIRKARGQVTRLTNNLEKVSFGNIKNIRVRLQPVERMEQILRALREGAAQELLFQTDMPIEEALDEIFRRYGGGRSAGQRLLDYREYVHLQVEVRRKSGADWEIANPTRLSTGEAIGVGAALMMVILTEWERDATLLRGKRVHGSLRFLFLDEANRLSTDNLGVLFDLCQTLDLQLMIAAPEVARAGGNTTYHLVRQVTPEGHEEVQVFGRRTRSAG